MYRKERRFKLKVALMSFHNAYNYGAALQAYALQYAVEQQGVECEYINYVNKHRIQAYDMRFQFSDALKNKKFVRAAKVACGSVFMLNRRKAFDRFFSKYLKTTQKIYRTSSKAKELNEMYDKFIVGSDQVWNPFNNGRDTAYLLDFVSDDTKKISYSSSFGADGIDNELKSRYIKYLSRFSRLSVREQAGVDLIKEECGIDAHLVLDPVFLPDRSLWNKMAKTAETSKKDYFFFYTNSDSQINDFMAVWKNTTNRHILSSHVGVKDFLDSNTEIMFSMSPEKFLNEIKNANLVITASFHCLAFSIIFHKQFMVLLTGNHGKDERLVNLLKITGLESRIMDYSTTKEQIMKKIDYDEVDKRLKPHLDRSKDYLRRAIFSQEDIPFEEKEDVAQELICTDDRCFGCGACSQICSQNAISMKMSWDGFLKPVIDEKKCIRCGLCHNVCQVFVKPEKQVGIQKYYAVKNTDEIRRHSSSGGAFTALSDYILRCGGYIAASVIDKDYKVKFIITNDSRKRDRMRNTFYVQSDSTQIYSKIKKALSENKKVMFVGTSCQVVGLRRYLNKDYPNLFICDIVCHGAPSPAVFESYIKYLKNKGELTDFKFRDKLLGWGGYTVSAVINGKKVKNKPWLNSFNVLFSHNVINRISCSMCPYTSLDRVGDISIGDFWGIKKKRKDFYDKLGVSLLIVNNEKGAEWLSSSDLSDILEFKADDILQNSLQHPSECSKYRNSAFRILKTRGYKAVAEKYGEMNTKGFMKNIVRKAFIIVSRG